MPRARKINRGIAVGSGEGGWKATEQAQSAEERWARRVERRATGNKRPAQIKRLRRMLWASKEEYQQLGYIAKAVELAYGFTTKPEELEAIRRLLFENEDLLFVAKTSFGKSVILQLLPCLIPDASVLILNAAKCNYDPAGKEIPNTPNRTTDPT